MPSFKTPALSFFPERFVEGTVSLHVLIARQHFAVGLDTALVIGELSKGRHHPAGESYATLTGAATRLFGPFRHMPFYFCSTDEQVYLRIRTAWYHLGEDERRDLLQGARQMLVTTDEAAVGVPAGELIDMQDAERVFWSCDKSMTLSEARMKVLQEAKRLA